MNASDPDMKPAPQREEALFQAAAQLGGAERTAFLNGACHGDPALRRRIDALLAAHDAEDSLLAEPATAKDRAATIKLDFADVPANDAVGLTIGRYKLLEKLGEGGCGVVYVAEQTEPVRRRVALKVIKLGMDTKQVVARFEAERQALAMMDHPNIAKVLDAGTTEPVERWPPARPVLGAAQEQAGSETGAPIPAGRPYFVMELVRGIRITDYCDQANLSTKERLNLFIKVCHAIQHAHQKGIIHRDIKPSNILVTLHDGVPVPKVIDFGIAKATEGRLTDATVYTQLHQFIGTPAYMSPEQAEMSGLDIDTRSDIYSLGVLLYELLAGSTPFDTKELMASGIDAMRRTIREKEPVRPSTRLTQRFVVPPSGGGADGRSTRREGGRSGPPEGGTTNWGKRSPHAIKELINLVRGDLDWIVMKCLEKDRARRYETANGLAMDIQRHLSNETVVARPPSTSYRLQKTFRRNKLAFAAAAAVVTALALGLAFSGWQAARATRSKVAEQAARRLADQNARAAQESALRAERERQRAEFSELEARRTAYAASMNLAQQALAMNNLGRARDLLLSHRPKRGQQDLRGWEWRYLWQQCQSDELFLLDRNSGNTRSGIVLSADGKFLAVQENDLGSVSVFDLTTRQIILTGRSALISPGQKRISFSPVEPLLAFHEQIDTNRFAITLWNAAERKVRLRIPTGARIGGVGFASDGRCLGTLDSDTGLKLWDAATGREITTLSRELRGSAFAVAPVGEAFAYGLPGGKVGVIVTGDHPTNYFIQATKEAVMALSFSLDGQTLATGSGISDSVIKLWDVKTGAVKASLTGHQAYIHGLAFSPDGRWLASASSDQTIRLWDWQNARSVATLRGHADEVWAVAFTPDGRSLFSASKDGTIRSWSTTMKTDAKSYLLLPVSVQQAHFLPDSRTLAILDQTGTVGVWDVSSLQQTKVFPELGTKNSAIALSPDGRLLVVGGSDGRIQVWDLARQHVTADLTGFEERIRFAGFHSRGRALFAVASDGTTRVWRTDSWQESWTCKLSPDIGTWGREIQAAPESGVLAVAGHGNHSQVWSLSEQKQISNLAARVLSFAFCPGGKWMDTGSWAGTANLWSLPDMQKKGVFRRHLIGVHSVTFSPDGKRLATGSTGREAIKIWDVETQTEMITLEGEGASFGNTMFSPDGNWLISVSRIGLLHLWRAPSWAEIEAAEANQKREAQKP
ncbi:MAG: protein kinase [Verrucomicrobia bacterium]|nr:protein kinase [Verrucomicrobiota bacterium]